MHLSGKNYEISYMHRETPPIVLVAKNDFIISGQYRWYHQILEKNNVGVLDFIKSFRAHSGPVTAVALSPINAGWLPGPLITRSKFLTLRTLT